METSGPEIAYGRLRADPAVGVGDLCGIMSAVFKKNRGARVMGEIIEQIDKSQIGWKTAPQACVSSVGE